MARVIATQEVPGNCSTCLYGKFYGRAHADRQKDWAYYRFWRGLKPCPSWWLDQTRFERAW